MPKGRTHSRVLSAFAGWLVILASYDDVNFARVVLPSSTPASEDLLPLDDPNTDFTESSQSRGLITTYRERCGCTSSVGRCVAEAALISPFAALAHSRPPRRCSNPPLRC
jgi:hypothetical protein